MMSKELNQHVQLSIACTLPTIIQFSEDERELLDSGDYKAFEALMDERRDVLMGAGPALDLVSKFSKLVGNDARTSPVVLSIISRAGQKTARRVFKSLRALNVQVSSAFFLDGGDRFPLIKSVKADLFLSTSEDDVRRCLDEGIAAAKLSPGQFSSDTEEIRLGFDGDAVLFSDEAEQYCLTHGLEAFQVNEANRKVPMAAGPFAAFARKVSELKKLGHRIHTCLCTARSAIAAEAALMSLEAQDIEVDSVMFLGGMPKGQALAAAGIQILFDDTRHNLESAASAGVLGGHALYGCRN